MIQQKILLTLCFIVGQITPMEPMELTQKLTLDTPLELEQLAVCKGHENWVTSVCVTPDNRIVSGSWDNTVRIWDMDGTQLAVCKGHEDRVNSVSVTPDNRIVSGSFDKTVRIWDMNGTQLAVCKGHEDRVNSVSVTPDNRIVSGSFDKTVRIWDMNGTQLAVCKGHERMVMSVCVTPDNKIVSGSNDNTVRIWEVKKGIFGRKATQLAVCKGHEDRVLSVRVTPDNRIVSGSFDKTVRIWDMNGTQLAVCKGHESGVLSVRVTPDNRIVSGSGSQDNTVRIWDMNGTQLAVCKGHVSAVFSVCVTQDNRIVSGSQDNTVRIWDMSGTQLAVCRGHEKEVLSVCVIPDNRIVSCSEDMTVRIWDMSVITAKNAPQQVLTNVALPTQKNETPPQVDPTRSPTIFKATAVDFAEHPTFVGKIKGRTYELWKRLSYEEAELLRPLIFKVLPSLSPGEDIAFTLGKGNFGAIYAGCDHETREIFAIKEVFGRDAVDESLAEGKIVYSLEEHLHCMSLIDYIHYEPSGKQPRLFQVMPLSYLDGSAFNVCSKKLPTVKRERIASDSLLQLMKGLEYLHNNGIVHLDIKADNTLYMKDGTLRIADFGRAQHVGEHDRISDRYSLGDMRKFSPEIIAFIRYCLGIQGQTVESFSGKGADVWAAGLYTWELLEDIEDNLYSTKGFVLEERVNEYTSEVFEELVDTMDALKGKYSRSFLSLLRQILAVDPEMRAKTAQVIKKLAALEMNNDERKIAFEEAVKQASGADFLAHEDTAIYHFAKEEHYLKKSPAGQGSVPADFYAPGKKVAMKEKPSPVHGTSPSPVTSMKKVPAPVTSTAYVPADFYSKNMAKDKATQTPVSANPPAATSVPGMYVPAHFYTKDKTDVL